MFKKIIFFLIIFFILIIKVDAKQANVYLFYGDGCPHCSEAHEYLDSIKDKYDIKIYSYEVWYNEDNKKLMNDVGKYLDFNVRGVPFVVIDNTPISGFKKNNTEVTYNYHIKLAQKEDFKDEVGIYLNVVDEENVITTKKSENKNKYSLTDIIKLGFKNITNYCYISLLFILIGILITLKDKKDILKIIIIYLISSSMFYIIISLLGIHYDKLIYFVLLSRFIIILISLILGLINLNNYSICLTKNKVIYKKRTLLFIIAIFIAISSKLLELSCKQENANLFINVLEVLNVSSIIKIIYVLVYSLIILVDDIIILIILYFVFSKLNIKDKYRYLISAAILLLIGFIMIVKPDIIIFSF